MTKFNKEKVIINKRDSIPHGKKGTVVAYKHKIRKYEVQFSPSWVGWFKLKELILRD